MSQKKHSPRFQSLGTYSNPECSKKQKFQISTIKLKFGILKIEYFVKDYFPLFASLIYFSKAIVIEGVSGVGARISILKP